MQDTHIISPDGQSIWNGTEWMPYAPSADVSNPQPPAADKSRMKHVGLKITGGVLAVLVAVGIATAGAGEDTGAEAASTTSASTLPPVKEVPYEEPTSPDPALSSGAQHFLDNYGVEFVTPEVCNQVNSVYRATIFSNINVAVLMRGGSGYSEDELLEAFSAAC